MWVFLNFVLGALPPEIVGLKGGAIAGKHISAVSYSDCSRRKPLTVADCHQIRLNSGRQHINSSSARFKEGEMADTTQALISRVSVPPRLLGDPAPSGADLDDIMAAAMSALIMAR